MSDTDQVLGILKDKGIITEEHLKAAIDLQAARQLKFDDALEELGAATPEEIIKVLAEQSNCKIVNLSSINIPEEVIASVPKKLAKKYHLVPTEKQNGVITVAMNNPYDMRTVEELRFALNTDVECVLATSKGIEEAIMKYYEKKQGKGDLPDDDVSLGGMFDGLTETAIEIAKPEGEATGEDDEVVEEGPIVKLVSYIIEEAIRKKASDIHIEPLSKMIRIRLRIDGVCQEVSSIKKNALDALVSRIKILASMDITERRKPQDGRINLKLGEKPIDLRVSIIPTSCGESVVMRLLEKSGALMRIKNIGFSEKDFENIETALKKPNGIILITGPTGSGKSTSLYAALNYVNSVEKKIITVEDPIEYTLAGANQCEVNEKIGLTFPNVLRTMLRQDPNIVVVGEIRDVETAEIAISAALTGHLVLSTLHTNDAPSAITRLADMGVHSFLVSSAILAVLAQRLVRVICTDCKTQYKPEAREFEGMGLDIKEFEDTVFYRGEGCDKCNNGYRGRRGVYEFMCTCHELKEAMYNKAGRDELRKIARANGMTTLMEDGIRLVKEGVTTLEEVARVAVK